MPMPTNPARLIVMPDEVALNRPPGVILNLLASELSKPRNHISVPLSWKLIYGSPEFVWLIVNVVVAVRAVNVGESVRPRPNDVRAVAPLS